MTETAQPLLIATTETVAGHRIIRTLGYVDGQSRTKMVASANRLGANAVVAVRWGNSRDFDSTACARNSGTCLCRWCTAQRW